ncbi:hypothetical protein Nepgr_032306 [Nepenthes gracilis]|uniref:Uncharacterized protein n=1 Tax=Nepenthes gracilis TaxID=150966 RepID=A0AAD3Y5X9_NEPGR|nr:hypothetical protein Nepgr_032306 [Nepenthes gracilis]
MKGSSFKAEQLQHSKATEGDCPNTTIHTGHKPSTQPIERFSTTFTDRLSQHSCKLGRQPSQPVAANQAILAFSIFGCISATNQIGQNEYWHFTKQ